MRAADMKKALAKTKEKAYTTQRLKPSTKPPRLPRSSCVLEPSCGQKPSAAEAMAA